MVAAVADYSWESSGIIVVDFSIRECSGAIPWIQLGNIVHCLWCMDLHLSWLWHQNFR